MQECLDRNHHVSLLAMARLAARLTFEMYFPASVSWSLISTLSIWSALISLRSKASMRLISTELSLRVVRVTCGWWPSLQCGCTPQLLLSRRRWVWVLWSQEGGRGEQQVICFGWLRLSWGLWWWFCWSLRNLGLWFLDGCWGTVGSSEGEFDLLLFGWEAKGGLKHHILSSGVEESVDNHRSFQ